MKRMLFRIAEFVLTWTFDISAAGLMWLDEYDTGDGKYVDELEYEFNERAGRQDRTRVTVSLPRHHSRNIH